MYIRIQLRQLNSTPYSVKARAPDPYRCSYCGGRRTTLAGSLPAARTSSSVTSMRFSVCCQCVVDQGTRRAQALSTSSNLMPSFIDLMARRPSPSTVMSGGDISFHLLVLHSSSHRSFTLLSILANRWDLEPRKTYCQCSDALHIVDIFGCLSQVAQ